MAKIYLKKVPEKWIHSCRGCYFFDLETLEKNCKEKVIKCLAGERIIYIQVDPPKPPMLGDMEECLPHQYPEFDPHYRGDPRHKVIGKILRCHACKRDMLRSAFKKIKIKNQTDIFAANPTTKTAEPIYEDIYAYACRNCGTIRLKPEDL